uniref:Fanconi anemia-associated protein of 100 kDa-like n=1 Tax=Saccoglossus kowalevskii TaxID=10224 RepID=A0ABM0GKY6_SACKO|nr:PREDICTED: Fanconi anemia-associated protein of 100 kDa-like [Saccoglossus kowalevskii]
MKSAQCDPDTSNQDIFAGLLSDDEKMNVKDAEDADDDDIEISVSTEYVIMVEEKDLFMEARNINAILPLQGHIIVCSYERNDIIVSVYRGKVDGMERKDTNAFLLYRTFISLKQTLGGGLNEVASQTLYTPRNRNCILVCSMPSSVDKPRVHSEKILFLEPSYFSMLFGPENCLTDCPVILMSTPDGRIFYLPMKNLKNDIPAGGFSLPIFPLYNMEERLMNIHDMYLHSPKMDAVTTEEAPSNALVLVGNSGKIVIISNQKGRLNFKVYNVRGPVLCSSVHCTSQLLVYCTQSNTYIARITNANSCDARNSSKFNSHAALLPNVLTPVDTGICGVLDVICTNTGHEAGSVHLSALKHNGQVVKITMKTGNHEDDITTYTTAAIAGQKIKELLSLISSVSEKLVEQNTKIDTVNCALEELNQAAHIACTINDGSVDSLESGFKCVVVPYVKDRGCTCEYGVTIKLTNDSPWILTSSWCWIICIQDRQVWSEGTAKQITKSVHFNHLQPGDFHEIDIPLDCDDDVQFSLPITVSSYLHFNTLQVMERLDINAAFPESDITLSENGICLQLSTDMLDVLHFLRTLPRTALLTSVGCRGLFSRQGSKLEYTLHQIAQHRPACESGQADAKTLEGHRFTAKVLISTELVHHYIVKEGDLITEDNKSALQSQLLNLLFTKNVMLPDSEVIQLLTPQGFHITVMCNLVVMDKNQVIELKIMTDSVALLSYILLTIMILPFDLNGFS